jgi:2-dehydro-3-deoxygluconokinase
VLFGELLMRLDAAGTSRLVQAEQFHVHYTGGEANAGVALAGWGHDVRMISRVPANNLGQACVNHLRRYGVDTHLVQRAGHRLGLFFVEPGVGPRPTQLIYDRRDSAFTTFSDEGLDWDSVFATASWFHFAGTALATAERLMPILQRACVAAKRRGLVVSCDLNYRQQLWSAETAGRTMAQVLEHVDVFVCGVEDAGRLFGIAPGASDSVLAAASDVARQLAQRFSFSHVAVPLRENLSASRNSYSVLLQGREGDAVSRSYEIVDIVDRIGAGDAKMAGLIHGLGQGWSLERTVEFAAAAACLKHGISGDFNLVSLAEVEALAAGDASGRIRR